MTDRSNYQRVGVEVDEQSFGQLTQRVNDTANSMNRLTQVNQSVADSAQQAGTRLQQAFSSVKSHIDENVKSVQQLRDELTKLDVDEKGFTAAGRESYAQRVGYGVEGGLIGPSAPSINDGGDGGGGFGKIGTFRRGVSAAGNLGVPQEVIRPLQIVGDLAQINKEFEQL